MLKRWFVLLVFLVFLPLPAQAQDPSGQPVADDPDTLVVSAERVSIEEVIEAIGRKMEQELYRMSDVSYTTLITQILQIAAAILLGVETGLPVIPSLDDMPGNARHGETCSSWHP